MKIGKRVTNPGELRTSISVESPTSTPDAGGFQVRSYTAVATVLARWRNLHGAELFADGVVQSRQPARVLIRYRSDIDVSWSVVYGGQRYEITGLDNINARGEYIELTVQRTVGG